MEQRFWEDWFLLSESVLIRPAGVNCEVDVDECEADPCQNGATCHDHVGLYTCECVPGYEGINCELDINECDGSPCHTQEHVWIWWTGEWIDPASVWSWRFQTTNQ